MADPRHQKLADIIVHHSVKVRPGEKVLVEAFDIPAEFTMLLIRTIADNPKTFRFASTAPYYVEVGAAKQRISRSSARFFLQWVRERAARVKVDDADQRAEVLEFHAAAQQYWQDVVARANAE